MPERVQLSRRKGWRMPANTMNVARPTRWGNPWRVGDHFLIEWPYPAQAGKVREMVMTAAMAVELYRQAFTPDADEIRAELAGKNLACWCKTGQPCHADVLLELANS